MPLVLELVPIDLVRAGEKKKEKVSSKHISYTPVIIMTPQEAH